MLYKIELIDGSSDVIYITGNSPKSALKKLLKITRSSRQIIKEEDEVFTTLDHWKYKVTEVNVIDQLKDNIAMLDAADLHDFASDICYTAFGDVEENTTCDLINAFEQYASQPFVQP